MRTFATILFVFVLTVLTGSLKAQEVNDTLVGDVSDTINTVLTDTNSTYQLRDDIPAELSKGDSVEDVKIYGWHLDENFITPIKQDIDTLLDRFHIYNPIKSNYASVSYLGNYGSAYLSNEYFKRYNSYEGLLFLKSYEDYFSTYKNTQYINTLNPFTHLIYKNSGTRGRDQEENVRLFHSQNINEKLNFGFDVNFISSLGQYLYQKINNNAFSFFSSYTSRNYNMHISTNLNRYKAYENGQINDSAFLANKFDYAKTIPVNFSGGNPPDYKANVSNKIRYVDAMLSQKMKLFTLGAKDSTKSNKSIAEPTITHVLELRRVSKIYEHINVKDDEYSFYPYTYMNPVTTFDSTGQFRIKNKLQLDFKTKIRGKVTAGVFASINHEYNKYDYHTVLDSSLYDTLQSFVFDTISQNRYNIGTNNYGYSLYGDTIYHSASQRYTTHNVFVNGGLYGRFWGRFESRFWATLYLSGYKFGQTSINGLLESRIKILSNNYTLSAQGAINNIIPSYQYTHYYSNHYIWETDDLKAIQMVDLSGKVAAPSKNFEFKLNYRLLSNHIYLTENNPEQTDKEISVLALTFNKKFDLWKFHSINNVVYQVSSDIETLELPSLLWYNSTYFDHTWEFDLTGGRLRTMLGVDVYYHSTMDGYSYNPALAMFYQDNLPRERNQASSIGNYPFIDFWLNIRLKRIRFYAKYEHANSEVRDARKYYFNAVSYPANLQMFKIGLAITFYD